MRPILLLVLSLTVASCDVVTYFAPIRHRSLSTTNPTSYVFDAPIDSVHSTIVSLFADYWERQADWSYYKSLHLETRVGTNLSTVLFHAETKDHPIFSQEYRIFDDTLNHNDVFVHSFGTPTVSPVYSILGSPVEVAAGYHFHLISESPGRTRVEIKVLNPHVTRGFLNVSGHTLVLKQDALKSSSVEEYKFLLYVGHGLKQSGMPPLIDGP